MVMIDEKVLADMLYTLIAYKFKLCEPPKHDGRQDVYLAACAIRDARLACVKELLEATKGFDKSKASQELLKAFS